MRTLPLPRELFMPIIERYEANCQLIYFDTSHLGVLEIKGHDAGKLLQGQCSIDVASAPPYPAALFSAICNEKGRVLSLFYLLMRDEAYYFILPRNMVAQTLKILKKYAVFYKTSIIDVTSQYNIMGVLHLADQLSHTLLAYRINEKCSFLFNPVGSHDFFHVENKLSAIEWERLLLYYHYPSLRPDDVGKWQPYEIGLLELGAVSLDKGCYTGQEVIARIQYRSKRHFVTAVGLANCPTPPINQDIYYQDKQSCGFVINAISTKDNSYLLLLSVKQEAESHLASLFLFEEERYDIKLYNEEK